MVDTDVDCGVVEGTSVTVGELGTIETVPPTSESSQCAGNHLGSVVLVPSGSNEAEVAFKVVTALQGTSLDTCGGAAAADNPSCIVARRALRYVPNTPLTVLVNMVKACAGKICDPQATCVNGACVSATIPNPVECEGSGCSGDVLPPEDGGAGPSADGAVDATLTDANPPEDGGPDTKPPADSGGKDATIPGDSGGDATAPTDAADAKAPTDAAPTDAADATAEDSGSDAGPIGVYHPLTDAGPYLPAADCDVRGTQPGAAWPQEGCCPTHRNRAPYVVNTSGSVALRGPFLVDGNPVTAPAVAADGALVIASGYGSTIVALNYDGSFRWRYTDPDSAAEFVAMPVLAHDGSLHAYDAHEGIYVVLNLVTGATELRASTGIDVSFGAALPGGSNEFILDNISETLEARYEEGGLFWPGPAGNALTVLDSGAIVSTTDTSASATTAANGNTFWQAPIPMSGSFLGLATMPGDSLVGYTEANQVVSFTIEPDGGVQSWQMYLDGGGYSIQGLSIADNGTTFVASQSVGLVPIDPSGNKQAPLGNTSTCGPPLIDAAGNLVVWCDGYIQCRTADFQTLFWTFPAPSPPGGYFIPETPVVGPNGSVYFIDVPDGADGGAAVYEIGP